MNLLDAIKSMMRAGYDYLDLDEVLEFFSIKGPVKKDFSVEFDKVFHEGSTSQEEDIEDWVERRKLKKLKSL